jgi:hypothetical protein
MIRYIYIALSNTFVSDMRQIGDFLWVLWFPPPIKLVTVVSIKSNIFSGIPETSDRREH